MKSRFPRKLFSLAGRLVGIVCGITVLVLTIAWLSGMFVEKTSPGWNDRGVAVASDQPTDVVHEIRKEYIEEAIGTLKASSRTVVSSKLLATIERINVTAGDEVTAGQELIRLDGKEYQTRLDQAKQALEGATAHRAQAQRNFDRVHLLMQQNAASPSDKEMATRDLQVAQAEENRARQAVSEAAVMISYTKIITAKNGRIVDRFAEPGDIAKPGEPILVLYDATSLRLEAPVMEHLAVKLRIGDQLKVFVDALDKEYDATIDEIVPQADAPSRSFLVKASLPKSNDLYEGMFGRLRIPAGERRHLCLADDAVIRVGQLEFVDVVLPDDTIERRLIKSGQMGMPGRHEVLSGLKAGEKVMLQQTPQM
ncbi:efflux RND transporter periplasmic adaptor subunit [Novipirellula artificiosorum]|uniref:Multidrug efflux pump subunit AcrA n=1 Tax=Novipirellula artificiosorum TaxID=2528016 RepID=A0A5C6D6V7_9BACT|nr:efflux RND transporter periplasmic adaptor subunit [Novipirellula artificiosorum]TWU30976.1 Multidrug efflux pump subunit AcrA precursor [Novipirellula artificiosorum]